MERDTLNIKHMTATQKLALYKKLITEIIETLHLETDPDFETKREDTNAQISFTVKVKKENTKSK